MFRQPSMILAYCKSLMEETVFIYGWHEFLRKRYRKNFYKGSDLLVECEKGLVEDYEYVFYNTAIVFKNFIGS